jgi:hypothetical protein
LPQFIQAAAIAVATLGTGAATMSVMNEDIPDFEVPDGPWTASGALDGMSFEILGRDEASGAVLEGLVHFRDGGFQSADCQEYCDFGWSDYQTKEIDGVIHFTTRTVCPDAPHTVVFYGQVDSDAIAIEGTWTTRRWYWTNQIVMTAEGDVAGQADGRVSG